MCWMVLLLRGAFQTNKISETFDAIKFRNLDRESFRKLRKLLNFRNAIHGTEIRTIERKFGEKGTVECEFSKKSKNFRNYCSITYWKFPKIQTGIFGRLESCTSHHLELKCGNEDSVQCKTTYLDSGKRILFNLPWQRAAFKYWFEAATKGHPGSCLAVGEGVSSGLYVDRNCPLGVV